MTEVHEDILPVKPIDIQIAIVLLLDSFDGGLLASTYRNGVSCRSGKVSFKVIPQILKLPMNFCETYPDCSLPSTVSENTIKMIGHHARLTRCDRPILSNLCLYSC